MLPFGVTILATVPQKSEFPKGLMNYPVYFITPSYHSICEVYTDTSDELYDGTLLET